MYLHFHKSTLLLNWGTSLLVSLFFFSIKNFAFTTLVLGFSVALIYKQISKPNEFYFYYNAGISKLNLIIVNFLLNVVFASILIQISQGL